MSATFTTPKFMNSLATLAMENRVSNKDVRAKKQAKAQRVKAIHRQRKIADQMDKELTKLENIANKEAAKQAKIQEKEDAKQAKIQEKALAKETKAQEKALAKEAKAQEKAHEKAQEKALAKEAKAQEKALAKEAKAQEKAQEKKTKKATKVVERNDRQDIIQTLCEKLGHTNTNGSVEVTA